MAIDLPEGSTVDAENVKVTVLTELDRLDVASNVSVDGGSTVTVTFPEATPAGSLVMVECNRTLFPGEGGTFGLTGSYTTADGQTFDMPATDKTIDVISMPAEQLSVVARHAGLGEGVELEQVPPPVLRPHHHRHVGAGGVRRMAYRHRPGGIVSFPIAIPLGLLWSFMRMAKASSSARYRRHVHQHRARYPLFLQIYIAFFGLPLIGISMDLFVLGASCSC